MISFIGKKPAELTVTAILLAGNEMVNTPSSFDVTTFDNEEKVMVTLGSPSPVLAEVILPVTVCSCACALMQVNKSNKRT
jgi:hypothetical protein